MSSILARLVSDLDIAVLERTPQGSFNMVSEMPEWLSTLIPETTVEQEDLFLEDIFLFLDDFLERHASFWNKPTLEQITSGVWTEALPDGKEQLLQATALFVQDRPLLLLKVPFHQEAWPIYQHAREQRLENEQLIEEINKREVLLHCIVHDLSNPLSGIKGSLDLLLSEELVEPEDGNELVQLGIRQATKMQKLIRSILSTFANEVKPLVPTLIGEDIAPDINACMHEVADSLSATASLRDVHIEVNSDRSMAPVKVVGETERLERVLFNLVANAIRHTPKGRKITMSLREEGKYIEASVEDEGTGVPEDLVDHLFDRFSQGNDSIGQAGLGLYFCRITVEGWGGIIGYRPSASGGACFWFRLPKPIKNPVAPASK